MMATTHLATGPRVLLRRLREIMAEPLGPQDRLDKIVQQIAANMDADVCSTYILRSDDALELYATKGLKQEAVHKATLKIGQGLVGTIASGARSLNLTDAHKHPAFAYLPETGEEPFDSFLGVPVLRAGRVLGVLVVQNQLNRAYRDDEVEALETTAMVLAELIATGELDALSQAGGNTLDLHRPLQFKGIPLSDGYGLGYVLLHEPRVVVTNLINENAQLEIDRLRSALSDLLVSIDVLFESGDVAHEGEHRDVLESYRMFANDNGWRRRLEEAISNGLTAEAAVEKVQNDFRARMSRQPDPFLRERLNDFDDLANRLLRQLVGQAHGTEVLEAGTDFIVVARNMGAAELLDYNTKNLRGLVLEEAGPNSHVVIVARALGIPVVAQLHQLVANADGKDAIIVDGNEGIVHLRPQADIESVYVEKVKFRASQQARYDELREQPSITADGVPIELLMNAGLMIDLPQLELSGAAGIGLFRTELQFMVSSKLPRHMEQEEHYRNVLEAAGSKPVTFRALDIGGDKVLPYMQFSHEENPALGWRAIRLSLDRPGLLRLQLRALLKAAAGRELRLMIPMITEVWELNRVRELIDREIEIQVRFGHPMPDAVKLGAMLEVPALLWQLDELMKQADFVSVGSNDLFQFAMASDRGNANVAGRFTPISRPFLRMLKSIHEKSVEHGTPLSLCGEIAGRPLSAMAILGLGYRSISMSPSAIGPVKAMLMSLELKPLSRELEDELAKPANGHSIVDFLAGFARENAIPI